MTAALKTPTGVIFALLTALGLGAITTQAKIFYADGGNAMTLMAVRFLVATLVFGLLLVIARRPARVAPEQRLPILLIAVVWSAAMIFYLLSVETISVSLAVLILYTYPLLVLIQALVSRQLTASSGLLLVFGMAFCGIYLALWVGSVTLDVKGIVFACLASVGAAYTFVRGARIAPLLDPLVLTFWVNAVGLLCIIPFILDQISWPATSQGLIALGAATLFFLVAILSQFQALARLPAATAAFVLNLEPVVSILLAAIILQEVFSAMQWLGIALVLTALMLSLRISKTAKLPN